MRILRLVIRSFFHFVMNSKFIVVSAEFYILNKINLLFGQFKGGHAFYARKKFRAKKIVSPLNSTNLQKPERFFYLPKEIVQELKFQGNSNHFCLSSRICEIFRKFKKEICSRIVGSNFSRHCGSQKLQQCAQNLKIRVFRTSYFDQFMNSGKHEFCDSARTVEIFDYHNAMKS